MELIKCKNLVLRPKNKTLRQLGCIDKCKHHLLIDGMSCKARIRVDMPLIGMLFV